MKLSRSYLALSAVLWLALPGAACADVLEVGDSGYMWTAGGPIGQTDPDAPGAQASIAEDQDGSGAALVSPEGVTEHPGSITYALDAAGPDRWRLEVGRLARKYDISPALLEAVVWQESRWNELAVSRVGARGLTQLMPGTAAQLGVDPTNAAANLEGGARYLRMQLDAFDGNIEKALAAYNAGPTRVVQAGGVPNIRETKAYVAAIMARLTDPVRR